MHTYVTSRIYLSYVIIRLDLNSSTGRSLERNHFRGRDGWHPRCSSGIKSHGAKCRGRWGHPGSDRGRVSAGEPRHHAGSREAVPASRIRLCRGKEEGQADSSRRSREEASSIPKQYQPHQQRQPRPSG